jgi:hypothetical protein
MANSVMAFFMFQVASFKLQSRTVNSPCHRTTRRARISEHDIPFNLDTKTFHDAKHFSLLRTDCTITC